MGSAGGAAATYMLLKGKKKEEKMKWECVEVSHHKNVEEQLKNGKRVAGISIATLQTGNPGAISHYLLFMRSE